MVVDTLDKIFGALEYLTPTVMLKIRVGFVSLSVFILLPLLWFSLSLINAFGRHQSLEVEKEYVLFLPNLGQNLATMCAVASGIPDLPVVFGCPHTVPIKKLKQLLQQHHGGKWQILKLNCLKYVS